MLLLLNDTSDMKCQDHMPDDTEIKLPIQAPCHRGDGFACTKYSYICSLHFVGENSSTAEYSDPTSAVLSTKHVSLYFTHDSLICELLNGYYVNTCSFTYCVKICVRYRAWCCIFILLYVERFFLPFP